MSEARARFSKVTRRMWTDERFCELSTPPPNGQSLWQRLITGPELTNIPGLFAARAPGLADAMKWPVEGFLKAFEEVSSKGMAKADWKAGLVWVPKAPKHNKPESPNVIRSWATTWEELPECDLKRMAYRVLRGYAKGWGEGFLKAFDEACPQPSPNQEQEQEQEQEQDLTPPARAHEVEPEQAAEEPNLVGADAVALDGELRAEATFAGVAAAGLDQVFALFVANFRDRAPVERGEWLKRWRMWFVRERSFSAKNRGGGPRRRGGPLQPDSVSTGPKKPDIRALVQDEPTDEMGQYMREHKLAGSVP